jgi:hypothetical protein
VIVGPKQDTVVRAGRFDILSSGIKDFAGAKRSVTVVKLGESVEVDSLPYILGAFRDITSFLGVIVGDEFIMRSGKRMAAEDAANLDPVADAEAMPRTRRVSGEPKVNTPKSEYYDNPCKVCGEPIKRSGARGRPPTVHPGECRDKALAAASVAAPKPKGDSPKGKGRVKATTAQNGAQAVKVRDPYPCATEDCPNLIVPTGKRGRPATKCDACKAVA